MGSKLLVEMCGGRRDDDAVVAAMTGPGYRPGGLDRLTARTISTGVLVPRHGDPRGRTESERIRVHFSGESASKRTVSNLPE
ncbi:MAG: hypothetical protein Q4E05_01725 [Pseudoclavibacter sp.]|nr:hypothetical protein [Pseudoclavibacter sp.]